MGILVKKKNSILEETITLGSPRAIVVVFSFGLFFLALYPTEKLGAVGGLCVFKNLISPLLFDHRYNCPGCGLTHALSRLMHADLLGAYNYNKLIVLVFPLIIFLIISNLRRWINQPKTHPVSSTGQALRGGL